ncbi:hypothetical protein MASR2M79_04080 [Aminivibrio sp.]
MRYFPWGRREPTKPRGKPHGADRGILLTDRLFAGSDTWATGKVLAAAIEKEGPFDLILAGEKATDGETGQVGPEVAALLDIPFSTYVSGLSLTEEGVEVRRTKLRECV